MDPYNKSAKIFSAAAVLIAFADLLFFAAGNFRPSGLPCAGVAAILLIVAFNLSKMRNFNLVRIGIVAAVFLDSAALPLGQAQRLLSLINLAYFIALFLFLTFSNIRYSFRENKETGAKP